MRVMGHQRRSIPCLFGEVVGPTYRIEGFALDVRKRQLGHYV
jgi:hypothetical protein